MLHGFHVGILACVGRERSNPEKIVSTHKLSTELAPGCLQFIHAIVTLIVPSGIGPKVKPLRPSSSKPLPGSRMLNNIATRTGNENETLSNARTSMVTLYRLAFLDPCRDGVRPEMTDEVLADGGVRSGNV